MPLTEKGEKIKGAMEKKYGSEKGEEVFYASKNKGTITGVDSHLAPHPGKGPSTKVREGQLARLAQRGDDNQHMGASGGSPPKAGELRENPDRADVARKLVAHCDRLSRRMDAFEARKNQSQPKEVKPKLKSNMRSAENKHPKEI